MASVACPKCRRPNAPHRVGCLYCGAEMPSPTVPPPARGGAVLPKDLDALVRQAMASGNTAKLRQAMEAARPEALASGRLGGDEHSLPSLPDPERSEPPMPDDPARSGLTDESRFLLGKLPVALTLPEVAIEPLADEALVEPTVPTAKAVLAKALRAAEAGTSSLAEVRAALEQAEAAQAEGDQAATVSALQRVAAAAVAAAARLPRSQTGTADDPLEVDPGPSVGAEEVDPEEDTVPPRPVVPLPPFRQAYGLVVECPDDSGKSAAIAKAMGTDGVTAGMIAVSAAPKVALRGADPDALELQASGLREGVGLRAAVFARARLSEMRPPLMVLRCVGPEVFDVVSDRLWALGPDPGGLPPGDPQRFPLVVLAVPGEVQIKRFRTGRGKQAGSLSPVGGKRLAVLDLHGVDCFLRIVQGITELDGLPGFIPQGAQRTMRALPENLGEWWPELRSVGARNCQPVRAAKAPEGVQPGEMITSTGWPAWEEHTRTCRILFDLPDLPFED